MANGFYGNISNVSKTQMQIDKIYPSRKEMDKNANADSVALGRYVLVEYGAKYPSYFHLYENHLYSGYPLPHLKEPVTKSVKPGDKVIILPSYTEGDKTFYHIWENDNGKLKPGDDNLAGVYEVGDDYTVEQKSTIDDGGVYNSNYNDDRDTYGNVRGYDSTVWMKVLKDGVYSYEHIADLNTVMPTFIVTVDAPQEDPSLNIPYMVENNDMLYDLHIHPAPKFRVKPAQEGKPSDETGLDIYFNEAGFNKKERVFSDNENYIQVKFSGVSGINYYRSNPEEPFVDTHELSISLPALGNVVSDVWDLVYSKDRKLDTQYYDIDEVNNHLNQKTFDPNYLAGCINIAQKWLGYTKFINDSSEVELSKDELNKKLIYYKVNDGKYYAIGIKVVSQPKYDEAGQLVTEGVTELALQEVPFDTGSLAKMMLQIYERVGADDSFDPDTINGAINTTALAVENYKKELLDAIKNAKTFKTISFSTPADEAEQEGTSIKITARNLADELDISVDSNSPITFSPGESNNSVKLGLIVENNLVNTSNPISSKAVKTEVDNITSLIGKINMILNYVNTGVKPESL